MAIFSSTKKYIHFLISPNVVRVVVNFLFGIGYISTFLLFLSKPPIHLHKIELMRLSILGSYIATWFLYANGRTTLIRIIFLLNLLPAFIIVVVATSSLGDKTVFQQLCGSSLLIGCSSALHMMSLQKRRCTQLGTLLAAFSGSMGSLPLFGFVTGVPVFLLPLVITTLFAILLLLPAEEDAEVSLVKDDGNILPIYMERSVWTFFTFPLMATFAQIAELNLVVLVTCYLLIFYDIVFNWSFLTIPEPRNSMMTPFLAMLCITNHYILLVTAHLVYRSMKLTLALAKVAFTLQWVAFFLVLTMGNKPHKFYENLDVVASPLILKVLFLRACGSTVYLLGEEDEEGEPRPQPFDIHLFSMIAHMSLPTLRLIGKNVYNNYLK